MMKKVMVMSIQKAGVWARMLPRDEDGDGDDDDDEDARE